MSLYFRDDDSSPLEEVTPDHPLPVSTGVTPGSGATAGIFGASTSTQALAVVADAALKGAQPGLRLTFVSCRESAGTPAVASFILRHGTTSAAPVIAFFNLGPSESARDDWPVGGEDVSQGIWIDWISGQVDIVVKTIVVG